MEWYCSPSSPMRRDCTRCADVFFTTPSLPLPEPVLLAPLTILRSFHRFHLRRIGPDVLVHPLHPPTPVTRFCFLQVAPRIVVAPKRSAFGPPSVLPSPIRRDLRRPPRPAYPRMSTAAPFDARLQPRTPCCVYYIPQQPQDGFSIVAWRSIICC